MAAAVLLTGPAGVRADQEAPCTSDSRSAQVEQELRERIGALERQVQALEALVRKGLPAEQPVVEAKVERPAPAPSISAGGQGFELRSADRSFGLRVRGLLHADSRFFFNDPAETAANTFVMRRVRPIVETTMFGRYDFRITPDFGDGRTVIQDAYADLRFTTALRIRGGKFKSPFGLERLMSAGSLLFIERGAPTAIAPNRDVGVMAHGDVAGGRLSYAAGVFNGVPDGASADADDRDSKEVVARVFALPFSTSRRESLQGLGVGIAASYGQQRGTAASPALATYRTAGQQTFFRYRSDGTVEGTAIADGARRRVSAQGYYYAGRFGLLVEQAYSSQRVRRATTAVSSPAHALQLAGSWVLTGEQASYRGVTPRAAADPAHGSWGAFEIVGRYNEMRFGDELFPLFANPDVAASRARAGGFGLNWFLNRTIKLVFDYEETRFSGGDPAGDRPAAREFLSRLQFSY